MIQYAMADARAVLALRHAVLRAGLPAETARFPGDEDATTLHVVALADGAVIACASFMASTWEGAPAFQLRGMAVAPEWQRKGVGAALLRFADGELLRRGARQLWCNARVPALAFYQRHGWQVVSDEFDIPTAGPHRKMWKQLVVPTPPSALHA